MSAEPRQREVSAVTTIYSGALSHIGIVTSAKLLLLWQAVPPLTSASATSAWQAEAVAVVKAQREIAQALGVAYYRLIRALLTGATVRDTGTDEPDATTVTLGQLRREFDQLARKELGGPPESSTAPIDLELRRDAKQEIALEEPEEVDDIEVQIEDLEDLDRLQGAIEKQSEDELIEVLHNLGPQHQETLVKKIKTDLPAREVDQQRQKAHDTAGARQAAAGSRVAMNGARSATWLRQEKDKRAIGWVRYSTTGTPCAWCAMLISRGPVYKSQQSAEYSDGDKFHDNDHCKAVPVFSQEQYDSDPKFELNRQMRQIWDAHAKGTDDPLNALRRYLYHNPLISHAQAA